MVRERDAQIWVEPYPRAKGNNLSPVLWWRAAWKAEVGESRGLKKWELAGPVSALKIHLTWRYPAQSWVDPFVDFSKRDVGRRRYLDPNLRTERVSQGKTRNSSLIGHTNGVGGSVPPGGQVSVPLGWGHYLIQNRTPERGGTFVENYCAPVRIKQGS